MALNEKDTDGKRVYTVADIAQTCHVSRATRAGPVLVSLIALSGSVSVSVTPGVAVLKVRRWLAGCAGELPAGRGAILVPDGVFHRGAASSRIKWMWSGQEDQFAQEVGVRTSVHRRFELFDAVHGAFDCAGVVFQGQSGDRGVQVAPQPGGE